MKNLYDEEIDFSKMTEDILNKLCEMIDALVAKHSNKDNIKKSGDYLDFKKFCNRVALNIAVEDLESDTEFPQNIYLNPIITVHEIVPSGVVMKKDDIFVIFKLSYSKDGTPIAEFEIPMFCDFGKIIHKLSKNDRVYLNSIIATQEQESDSGTKEIILDNEYVEAFTNLTVDHKIKAFQFLQNMKLRDIKTGGRLQKRSQRRSKFKRTSNYSTLKSKSKSKSKSKRKN